jgi:hypothetical protein
MEMRAYIMANTVPISIALAPNMLHHNSVGITYAKASNIIMKLVRFVPLYFVATFQSMVIVTEAPFVTTPTHTVVGMRFRPQTLRVIQHVSVHREVPKELNKVFARQPSYP